jgi:transcriptional regulator of acetoin/glycerol metabolism
VANTNIICLDDFKLDPAREYEPTILDQSRLKALHAEYEDLVQIARAEMDSLTRGTGAPISLASAERQALVQVIEQNHWNMTLVATHFKISRNALYRKIKRHGIPIARRSMIGQR